MASFDAGSIEARLTLDRSPFSEGLRLAKAEAAEMGDFEVNLRLNTTGLEAIERLRAQLASLGDANVGIDLNNGGIGAQIERIRQDLDSLDGRRVTVTLDALGVDRVAADIAAIKEGANNLDGKHVDIRLDTHGGEALFALAQEVDRLDGRPIDLHTDVSGQLALFELAAQVEALDGKSIDIDLDTAGASAQVAALAAELSLLEQIAGKRGSFEAPGLMMTAIATLAPAAVAAVGPLTAAMGGLLSVIAGTIPGVGALAAGIIPVVKGYAEMHKELETAQKKLDTMNPTMKGYADQVEKVKNIQKDLNEQYGPMVTGIDSLMEAWNRFKEATHDDAMGLIVQSLGLAQQAIPLLIPLFDAFAPVIEGVLSDLSGFMAGPEMAEFLTFARDIGPHLFDGMLRSMGNIGQVIMNLAEAFGPFAVFMTDGLQRMTARWVEWSDNLGSTEGFKNFIQFAVENGPKMLDTLRELAEALINVGEGLAPLGSSNLTALRVLAEVIAKLPPDLITALAVAFQAWAVGMWAYTAATTAAAIATTALDAAASPIILMFLASAGVVIAMVAAVVALGVGIYLLATRTQFFQTVWEAVWGAAKVAWDFLVDAVTAGVDWIVEAWGSMSGAMGDAWGWLQGVWDSMTGGIMAGVDAIVGAWNAVAGAAAEVWGAVTGAVTGAGEAILGAVGAVLDWFQGVWSAFWESSFGQMIFAALEVVVAFIKLEIAVIRFAFEWLLEGVKWVVGKIIEGWDWLYERISVVALAIQGTITNAWDYVHDKTVYYWNLVKALIGGVINWVDDKVSGWVGAIKVMINAGWDYVHDRTQYYWNLLKALVSGPLNAIKGYVDGAVDSVKGWIEDGWGYVHGRTTYWWGRFVTAVSGPLTTAKNAVSGAIGDIKGFFADAGSWLYNAGSAIIGGLISGITDKLRDLKSKMEELASIVTSHLPGSPVKEGPLRVLNNGYAGGMITKMIADGVAGNADLVRRAIGDVTDLAGMELGGTGYINARLGITPGGPGTTSDAPTPTATPTSGLEALLAEMEAMRKATEAMTEEFQRQNDNLVTLKRQGAI